MSEERSLHCDIYEGRCENVLANFPDNCLDSIVCDPPYQLGHVDVLAMMREWIKGRNSAGKGHLGLEWDVIPGPHIWEQCLRVLKPGGHVIASSHSRTYHLLALSMQMAGFEIRDQLQWLYSQGQIMTVNVAAVSGDESLEGIGTGLTPSHEPHVLARKPPGGKIVECIQRFGTGGLNLGPCMIGGERWPKNTVIDINTGDYLDAQVPAKKKRRKKKSPERVTSKKIGNVSLDKNCDRGPSRFFYCPKPSKREKEAGITGERRGPESMVNRKQGTAGIQSGRAGAGRSDAGGRANFHPTVKPISLMRYWIRLITPPGGIVLDPFFGSGTTGCAAAFEGVHCIGIEENVDHTEIAEQRVIHFHEQERGVAPRDHKIELQTAWGEEIDERQLPLFIGACAL